MNQNQDHLASLKRYRISESEFQMMVKLLGRDPLPIEWPLFSALWSEHCSYKSSRVHLKKFGKTLTDTVLNAVGENAGVVDLGHGECIVFKMESHNHPSFIEPYQGAATGVGGILRDIFTMGARPIAIADYLCFGQPTAARMGLLVDGVVRGIAGYGNSVGVPTITGQTNFDSCYDRNILVNAMAVGLLRPGEKVALSAAKGPGNLVVYVGAKTGKDGVHGAAMASESFDENSEAKKPNVQIGDPYFEKLLIESCLEVLQQDLVVAIQDMGAAGLTSSSFEMASKGNVGMRLRLDAVPVRDSSIQPEEILLSESQERMLLVCEPSKLLALQQLFQKWGLDAVVVGEIIAERQVEIWWKNERLTSIDPHLLVENAPMYERPYKAWNYKSLKDPAVHFDAKSTEILPIQADDFKSVQVTGREDIYRQYDQRVGLSTVRGSDHDVAILKLKDSGRALGMAVGCRPYLMKMDARVGALDAVMYPSLQLAVKGLRVNALTDCLNFGNPEKSEIMSEFVASVDAIIDLSLLLKAPVISGNVSFYNETLGENIISTPAIGVMALGPERADFISNIPEDRFQKVNSLVYRLTPQVPATKIYPTVLGLAFASAPDLQSWVSFLDGLLALAQANQFRSSQVVGRGGLNMAVAKMCLSGNGYQQKISLNTEDCRLEKLYQVIVEVAPEHKVQFEHHCFEKKIEFLQIGEVTKDKIELNDGVPLDLKTVQKNYKTGLRGSIENLA